MENSTSFRTSVNNFSIPHLSFVASTYKRLLFVSFFILLLGSTQAQYHLSFDNNTGDGSMSDTLLISGNNITLPITNFTKSGYRFTSWNTEADGNGTIYADQALYAIGSSNDTLYAQWAKYCSGSGTALDPWEICSIDELLLLSHTPDDWNAYFTQTSNISFPADYTTIDWDGNGTIGNTDDNKGFSPIGNSFTNFTGNYKGNGYSITNLYVNNNLDYSGLFGFTNAAEIENITLRDADINGFNYVGGIVGKVTNNTSINHVSVLGSVSGSAFTGGVVGSLEDSELKHAGFIGELNAKGSMAGGIIGRISGSTLLNSYSSGFVNGELQNVGGAIGFAHSNSIITNTYTTCGVIGSKYIGSFVGILSVCTITNCYATGLPIGEEHVGGFYGTSSSSTLSDCYYDKETTWQNDTLPGIMPITRNAFKNSSTFSTWDFGSDEANPWVLSTNGRPYLHWQKAQISNGLINNTTSGYIFSQAYAEDINTTIQSVGLRYKKLSDNSWTKLETSSGEGAILNAINNIPKDEYLVQAFAKDNDNTFYGDMTKMAFYTLSLDANGATGIMADTLLVSKDSIKLPAQEFTLLGYTFLEWNTKSDSTGLSYNDQDNYSIDASDEELFAIWSARNYSINYQTNGGSNATSNPLSYTVDSLIHFANATRTGYTFESWYAENSFLNKVDSLPLGTQQDTTIYAKWSIGAYNIVYHANNGIDTFTTESNSFDAIVNLASNSYSLVNHVFKYWTTASDGSGDKYYDQDAYTYGDSTLNLYAQWQKYCGGDGSKDHPWEICSKNDLLLLSLSPEDWNKHFIQSSDIVFSDSTTLFDWNADGLSNDATGFSPIGSSTNPFSGSYNGQNHIIENLFIDKPTSDNIGLFAYATDTIGGIGLINVNINGQNNTAALVGSISGAYVYNSYANGEVNGNTNLGGLVGSSINSHIKNAYGTCYVMGSSDIGGFIGSASTTTITNCYSTGVVISTTNAGAFIGDDSSTTFNSCYYDSETSQQDEGTGSGDVSELHPLTTEEFKNTSAFTGWNIGIGIEELPWMPNEDGRPYLIGQKSAVTNGIMMNSFSGYTLSEAYADSISIAPTTTGIRYHHIDSSTWIYNTTASGTGTINASLSGLNDGQYLLQALSQSAGEYTYGDMTMMTLRTLHFDANGGTGTMADTTLIIGDSIFFPPCGFTNSGILHSQWNTQADGNGIGYSPKGIYAISNSNTTLYAQWMSRFATDDFRDGLIGGSRVELDVTINDTIGGVPYGVAFPVEIIAPSTSGTVTIEGNQIIYTPNLDFSGPDFFTYLVDYNGAVDTAEVVTLVFDAPGNMVNADCYIDMPKYTWEISSPLRSPNNDIHEWTTPLVGDLYGTEYPEIVAVRGNSQWTKNDVVIYNGSETPLQSGRVRLDDICTFNAAATPMAIAKINTTSGSLQSTLFVSSTNRRMYAYNPLNGDEYWESNNRYCAELGDNEGAFVGVADFNNDGMQEVYAANRIYNAETGDLIASGSDTTDIGYFKYGNTYTEDYSDPAHNMMLTVTGDFDRNGDLELAAGRYLFDVDFGNGTMPIISQLPDSLSSDTNMIKDGITAVADIDIDGDLDIIVVHQTTREDFYCYVWDGQTPTLIAEKYIYNEFVDPITGGGAGRYGVGVPFIGDLNGDGKPEIAFTTSNRQYAFSYSDTSTELQKYYILEHTDRSGFTGLTLFDFNNDDIAEIVYRDETDLRIINASGISHITGNDTLNGDGTPILYNLTSFACESGTQSEFAVVVDIDLDNQAEIIVTNNADGDRLNIFESGATSKWVAARPVWNQYGYNVTNINNDLTVPTYAINNALEIEIDSTLSVRPYNHFLQQMGNVTLTGQNVILTADLYMSNSFYTNDGTTGTLTFDIINQGDALYSKSDSALTFYCGDPDNGGTLLAVDSIRSDINYEDTLKSQTYTFLADPSICPRIYVRLNDNSRTSFPDELNMPLECDYDNNTVLAAIFEITSHFTWNGFPLDSVAMNTRDTSDLNGDVFMLINRGDTVDIVPSLDGYLFIPDTIRLNNVQDNGELAFQAKKIPQIVINPKTVTYDQGQHAGDVGDIPGIDLSYYYKESGTTLWHNTLPDSAAYYSIKVIAEENYLYTAHSDSIDSILVIEPKAVSYLLDIEDKDYDGADTVVLFSTSDDALIGDSIILDVRTSDLHFSGVDANTYQVLPSANWSISGPDANNYELQAYIAVDATINKKLLTITANDTLKYYDGFYFEGGNGITSTGFALNEDTSNLAGDLFMAYSVPAQDTYATGTYDILASGFSSNNYDIQYISGLLNVRMRQLNIDFNGNAVIDYGDYIDMLDYTNPESDSLAIGDLFDRRSLDFDTNVSSTGHIITGVHQLQIGQATVSNASGDDVTANYEIIFNPAHISVLPKEVSITNASAQNKIYDATNAATIEGAQLAGSINGDSLEVLNFTSGQFLQTDIGTNIEVFYDNAISISGADAGNYLLMPFNSSLFADIYKKELTLSNLAAQDKYYDANDSALITGAVLNGVAGTDDVTLINSTLGIFAQSDAGNAIDVTTNFSLSGSKINNYYLTQNSSLQADITPLPLSITANDDEKTYDGIPYQGGNGISWSTFAPGEDTTNLLGALNYIGSSQLASDTGYYQIIPSGFSSNNYDISYVIDSLRINSKPLSINYAGGDTIRYGDSLDMDDYVAILSDLAPGENFYPGALSFGTDVSTSGNLRIGTHELSLGDAYIYNTSNVKTSHNYAIIFNTTDLTVTKKTIAVIGANVEDKTYDNTILAEINSASLDSVVTGDEVILDFNASGVFADENVATSIVVTPDTMSISGVDADNYTLLAYTTPLSADINKKELTLTDLSVQDKYYDANDSASITGAILNGVVGTDDVTLINSTLGIFAQSDAGDAINVSTNFSLSGSRIHNYTLIQDSLLEADIMPLPLVITANNDEKIYDGIPYQGGNGISWTAFATGEDTTNLIGILDYIGSSQLASDTGYYQITPSGFSSNNYDISYITDSLRINSKPLTINYVGVDTMTYGDSLDIDLYVASISGLASGENFNQGTLTFGTEVSTSGNLRIGNHKLSLTDAYTYNASNVNTSDNYTITLNTTELTVEKKTIAVIEAIAEDKTYDNTRLAVIDSASLDSVILGDNVNLLYNPTGTFVDENVATSIVVTHDSMQISGTDINNYSLVQPPTLMANILQRPITYVLDSVANKEYDGSDTLINIITASTSDTIYEDSISLDYVLSFEDKNAGVDIEIKADHWAITGHGTSNYLLNPYNNDSATILAIPLNIAANELSKDYDGIAYSGGNGIVSTGFILGEDTSDLTGNINYIGSSQMASDTGHYYIIPTGFTSSNYDVAYSYGMLTITPKQFTINYNGSDTANYGDILDMQNYTATLADLALNESIVAKNISLGVDTSSSGYLTAGEQQFTQGDFNILNASNDTTTHNYQFIFIPSKLWVEPKGISIINATVLDKVYDNTTAAYLSGAEIIGVYPEDDATFNKSNNGYFDQETVGTNIRVYTDSMHLSGSDGGNYKITSQPVLMADITSRPITYQLDTVDDKVYDGTNLLMNTINSSTSDTIYEDSVKLDFDLSFASTNAGKNLIIDVNSWQITGPEISNYSLQAFAGDSASIEKADLYFTTEDTSRMYGESNPNLDYTITGFVNGEDTTAIDSLPSIDCLLNKKSFAGNYSDAIIIAGGYDNNYTFITSNGTMTIKRIPLLANYLSQDTLIYGNEADFNNYSFTNPHLANNDSLYFGALSLDSETSTSGHYKVGSHDILTGEIALKDETGLIDVTSNYLIEFDPSFIVIKPKTTYANTQSLDKEYDGNLMAHIQYLGLVDTLLGDDVHLDEGISDIDRMSTDTILLNASFLDNKVGNNKALMLSDYYITGDDALNYDFIISEQIATITPRRVYADIKVNDKVYDGTVVADIDSISLSRVVEGDNLALVIQNVEFAQADAAMNIGINVIEPSITGLDLANYTLDTSHNVSASIYKASLAVGVSDIEYIYGDSVPNINLTYSGFVNEEDSSVIDIRPTIDTVLLANSDVGYYMFNLQGGLDNNYEFNYEAGQATVLQRQLSFAYTGETSICSNDVLVIKEMITNNLVLGDTLNVLDYIATIIDDASIPSGEIYLLERGETVIQNEAGREVTNNYNIDTSSFQVEVMESPLPDLGPDLEYCFDCEYDFDAGEGESYLWSTGDTTRYITLMGYQSGELWVRVTNTNQCMATDTVQILGGDEEDEIKTHIYPNPNNGEFYINISRSIKDIAYIYSTDGKLQRILPVEGNRFYVNISLPDATYVLKLKNTQTKFIINNSIVYSLE